MPRKSEEDLAKEADGRERLEAELRDLVRMGVDRLRRIGGGELDIAFFEKSWRASARAVKSTKDVQSLTGAILSTENEIRRMLKERGR